ncbi:TIGR02996 domain-containing protein [Frigoriglobus tundricola]|uniref:TIGR02996 domain-containing protein n=1 Tax=Frigoriglobus tundricola TaxID=2774151 RepID=A0A6M5Z282_9BACT|nr:TIGR02996 domain-containing protein [Frigoriglobus tundricola]QJW99874.1 hypothetical protein FTUN_7497 [Frigoriglobus tundricola]
MDDRTALLANVLNDPADDTARLVLADWLEERGESVFGRFIRAGVVAARFRGAELIDDPDYYAALKTLTDLTTASHPALWLSALGLGPSRLAFGDWSWDGAGDRVTVRIGAALGVFSRGMLAELDVTLQLWHAVAPFALAAWPIERVRATDVPGLTFAVERVEQGWRITGRLRTPRRNVPLTGSALPSAMAPGAVLAQSSADWAADQFFADREALVQGAARECSLIVDDLKDVAGDRWPRPPRRRRT